jgi:type IV secretion system protein VirB8
MDDISYRAQPMTAAAKEALFQQAGGFQAEREMLARRALTTGWWVGGIGAAIGVAGMICAATLFPLKTRDVAYIAVDQTSGSVGEMTSPKDAPKLFNETTIEGALRTYVELRENYLFETDSVAFHRVTIMSAPDEQVRFKAAHDEPLAPARALRDKGYVRVDDFHFYKVGTGKAATLQYLVVFTRKEMRAGQPVPLKGDAYSATIDFQFHPEYPMAAQDRQLNWVGLQVLSYQTQAGIVGGPK